MANMDILNSLVGKWKGENLVWESPDQEPHESHTEAIVVGVAQGIFLRIDYTWAVDGEPQSGSLLLGQEAASGEVTAAWVDSWHNGDRMMICRGKIDVNGSADIYGTYPALSGPDWGWRIVVEPGGIDSFRIFMYNITPQGVEALAVETDYRLVR
jgi:hypothetical protein